jgi:protein involved in polysaccharide export with SLBB domain
MFRKLARWRAARDRGGATWGLLRRAGFVAMLFVAAAAHGQTSPPARSDTVVSGDVLQVDVVGRSDISGQYTVDKAGAVKLPVVGSVEAAGHTTSELATDISRRVSLTSHDIPQVTVTILESFSSKNFVLGAVMLPGPYTFAKAPTVWEAISAAGGASEDADLSAVQIISASTIAPTVVDLQSLMRGGDLTKLPRLRPGDTVRVPWGTATGVQGGAEDIILVFGAVGAQGPQSLKEAPDLVRALIRSGPAADANLADVMIVRQSGSQVVSMKVNMKDYLGKASSPDNPRLQAGDTIYLGRRTEGGSRYLRLAGALVGLAATVAVLTHNY